MEKLYSRRRYGRCCVVPQCSMRSGTNHLSQVRSHCFPQDPVRRMAWLLAIRRANWVATPKCRICSLHFIGGKPSNDPSHPDWIPSIFPFNTNKNKSEDKLSRFQRVLAKRKELAGGSTSKQEFNAAFLSGGESILIKKEKDAEQPQCQPRRSKRKIDDESSSMEKQQLLREGGTPLPDAEKGESSSSTKREELAAIQSSQPKPTTSVGEASEPTTSVGDASEPTTFVGVASEPTTFVGVASEPTTSVGEASEPNDAVEPPPKKPKPKVEKVPAPSLIIEGPRVRKPAKARFEVSEKPESEDEDYVFKGRRLVNMGYFIKSLQKLNDHGGRKCNFSDMRVCAEPRDGWNVGIVFTCKLCPTTKVVWMEDPNTDEKPSSPIIFKQKVARNYDCLPPIQPTLLRAPTYKARQPTANFPILAIPPPAPQKRPRQPYWSKRKTPTPPPDDDAPAAYIFRSPSGTQITMPLGKLPSYPRQILLRPNTTISYVPRQAPSAGQLQVQPVIGQQVPTIAHSQQSIVNQSQVPIIVQSPVSVIDQQQGPVTGQTQLVAQLQGSVVGEPQQTHTIDQSQAPVVDFPLVTSIKQELILPDDGTNPSLINSSSEPTQVEMSFCVDQGEGATDSGSVPSDAYTTMDTTEQNFALTPGAFPHTQTSLQWPNIPLYLPTAMDVTTNHSIAPTDALPVDLNLVKKEVNDETP